ncbi:MAG TPA: protein translocase subunit SecF [Propionibacteriaceae bacterium]|nr:protein translocase subunit SecF [Propionibacteriaceae bacterium]
MSTPTLDRPEPRQSITHRLYTGDLAYNFIGRRRIWYTISAVALLISLVALLVRGLDLGIEFRGGSDFQVPTTVTSSTVSQFREAVLSTGVPSLDSTVVTTVGDNRVRIQTRSLNVQEQTAVRAAIAKEAGKSSDEVAYQLIGASWGKQITQQAAIALVVFLVLVGLLIWIYFRDAKMSIAALSALLHDLIITIGIYALVGFTVTPATMIGVLTILGYSLYDTVVVFDKIRENVASMEIDKVTYSEAANHAVNQVLVRSLNTTIIGVLPVAALLFAGVFVLGSGPLEDLGLALFVGMIAGAYSSIFIASPILAQLREREPEIMAHRERVERRRKAADVRSTYRTTVVEVAAPKDEATSTEEVSPSGATGDAKPAFTVTTVTAPSAAQEPSDDEVRTDEPAEDSPEPARTPTPRTQPTRQTRTRRKK